MPESNEMTSKNEDVENLINDLKRVDHHTISEELWRIEEFFKRFGTPPAKSVPSVKQISDMINAHFEYEFPLISEITAKAIHDLLKAEKEK